MTRRDFISRSAQFAAAVAATSPLRAKTPEGGVGESFVSERREIIDPLTGRKVIQLTSGADYFDMPMYYFIPTFAADKKTIVFYRYKPATGEIQLYKINVDTGVTVQLTKARTENSLWRPYLQPVGFGIRDLQSAINPVTNEAMYFDTNEIRAVNIDTLADRLVARVPEGRVPSGLTGVSPDGKYFCYPHFDRKWWEAQLLPHKGPPMRWAPRDSKLVVVNTATGETTDVLTVNFWITHTHFYDRNRIIFCHNATDFAIQLTDLRYPGSYENIRAHSENGVPNHYSVSKKGVMYEMSDADSAPDSDEPPAHPIAGLPPMAGLYNPDTRARQEYKLGITHSRMHIGRDPEARLWFYETAVAHGHGVVYFPKLSPGIVNPAVPLIGPTFDTFSVNQRSHHHPSITPDRKHILITGGDSRTRTNHLFLIEIGDLKDTVIESG